MNTATFRRAACRASVTEPTQHRQPGASDQTGLLPVLIANLAICALLIVVCVSMVTGHG